MMDVYVPDISILSTDINKSIKTVHDQGAWFKEFHCIYIYFVNLAQRPWVSKQYISYSKHIYQTAAPNIIIK
jgi:hypothetical protein